MFKVYKLQDKKKTNLFFQLDEGDGNVSLILVDKDGVKNYAGNVLRIDKDGLHLNTSITGDAPFKCTSNGRIWLND
jgi:hypothetical protein